jgi:exopolyphosphatase/pppGpp-phosphohydrolase
MAKEKTTKSPFQKTLEKACAGTSVTTRELVAALNTYDLAAIREGDMDAKDLKSLVMDIADSKDNASRYRVEQ